MPKLTLAITLALLLTGCALSQQDPLRSVSPDDVEQIGDWGAAKNVTRLRNLYFSAQPDDAALEAAHAAGTRIVINMREADRQDPNEEATARALGMQYLSIPIQRRSSTLNDDAIARISKVIADNPDTAILLHCGSGTRATGWLAARLAQEMPVDDALAVAGKAGLTNEGMIERVRTFNAAADR
ncbi:MAG: sulfur transferase domain-containing protein [Pseudomonadota bacterium]